MNFDKFSLIPKSLDEDFPELGFLHNIFSLLFLLAVIFLIGRRTNLIISAECLNITIKNEGIC